MHVVNGTVDEGLLAEVFSNEGIGTLVYANEYRQIRRARKRDVRSIEQLIHASVESEELLPRSRAAIEKQLDDYYLYEVDRNPVACVALHAFPEEKQGRAGLPAASGPRTRTRGWDVRMVQYVEERAREAGLRTLIALSTQAFNFFKTKAGFAEGIAGRPAARPPRAVRPERAAIEGADEEALAS